MNPRTNEDIVQETLAVVYSKYKQLDENAIVPYAYGVLDKIACNAWRTETRRHLILDYQREKYLEFIGQTVSIEDLLNYHELINEIRSALNRLSDKEKEVMKLKLEGHSMEQIQERTGLKPNAIYVRLFRAIKNLKLILKHRGIF